MDGVEIITPNKIKDDAEGTTSEFSTRPASDFILVTRYKGTISGKHYHEGKSLSKNPEIVILIDGKADFYFQNLETKEELSETIDAPTVIKISPNIWHEVKALTDITFLELNSLKQHQNDTIRQKPIS